MYLTLSLLLLYCFSKKLAVLDFAKIYTPVSFIYLICKFSTSWELAGSRRRKRRASSCLRRKTLRMAKMGLEKKYTLLVEKSQGDEILLND